MRLRCFVPLLLLLGPAAPVHADVFLTVGSASISQGGSGTADVLIRSTSTDSLAFYGFEFLISPTGPGRVEFANPQSDSQLTNPLYIFFGNSADVVDGVPVGVVSSNGGGTNNRYVGGDSTDDGNNVTVTTTDKLLARLNFNATTALPGDSFTLTLASSAFTQFRRADNSVINYTTTPGTILVTSSAIPEPGPLLLGSLASALLVVQLRRTRGR